MRKILFILVCGFAIIQIASASSSGVNVDKAPINPRDQASLQRGADIFVGACMGCHSLKYIRYNQVAKGIGMVKEDGSIDVDRVKRELIMTGAKIQDQMNNAMSDEDAVKWFGIAIPDLSLTARQRGADWLYSYLRGFYEDNEPPWGTDNIFFKDLGMPNVLVNYQGEQIQVKDPENHLDYLKTVKAGSMNSQEFDDFITDLVNFLDFVGEPIKVERQTIGLWALAFLFVFLIVAYLLKREYWKDVE